MRSRLILASLCVACVLGVIGVRASSPDQGGQAPKNLQVLPKDWNGQQVGQFMRNIVAPGLGVQCTFCHVQDRSSDEIKEKVVARKMLAMMMAANDALKDVGDPAAPGTYKVTCYMCHRGQQKPVGAPGL
jgi:hypothetical protein